MRSPRIGRALALVATACFVFACSFTVDLEPLRNEQCGSGRKNCGDRCVNLDDPQTGCASDSCTPCSFALLNAVSRCMPDGQCAIATCRFNFDDCDKDRHNGCETEIAFDPQNCGKCGNVCAVPNGIPGCVNKVCVVSSCTAGFGDCDQRAATGCETRLDDDPNNCGQCGNKCNAGERCEASKCVGPDGG